MRSRVAWMRIVGLECSVVDLDDCSDLDSSDLDVVARCAVLM